MDFVGPLPTARGNLRYFLVFIDLFSRFLEVYPCSDMTVTTVVDKTRDYLARYGFPDSMLSVRGSQKSAWAELLPRALLNYRTTPHHSTNYTPAELFLGFAVRSALPKVPLDDSRFQDSCAFQEKKMGSRKINFDRRAADRTFLHDQLVLVRGRSGKLEVEGHVAKVVRQINKSLVEVELNGRVDIVSSSRLSHLGATDNTAVMEEVLANDNTPKEAINPETPLENDRLANNPWKGRLRPLKGRSCDE